MKKIIFASNWYLWGSAWKRYPRMRTASAMSRTASSFASPRTNSGGGPQITVCAAATAANAGENDRSLLVRVALCTLTASTFVPARSSDGNRVRADCPVRCDDNPRRPPERQCALPAGFVAMRAGLLVCSATRAATNEGFGCEAVCL